MRSELTRAAVVLGVGFLIGCLILVVGMRWAIGSALSAHLGALERLDATMAQSAGRVEQSVSAVGVEVAAVGSEMATTLETSSGRVTESVEAGSARLTETVEMGFTQPVLVRVSERVPIAGVMAIEGLDQGQPIHVQADVGLVAADTP